MRSIWHTMLRRSLALLLAATFLTFVPIGFLMDVFSMGANSPGRLATVVAFSGFIAVGFVYSIRRDRRFLPLVIAVQATFLFWPRRAEFRALADRAVRRGSGAYGVRTER